MEAFVRAHNSYSPSLVFLSANQSSNKERATAAAHTPGAKLWESAWLSLPPRPPPSDYSPHPSHLKPTPVSEAPGRWKGICNAPPLTANCAALLGEVYWPCLRFKHTCLHQASVYREVPWLIGWCEPFSTCTLHSVSDPGLQRAPADAHWSLSLTYCPFSLCTSN